MNPLGQGFGQLNRHAVKVEVVGVLVGVEQRLGKLCGDFAHRYCLHGKNVESARSCLILGQEEVGDAVAAQRSLARESEGGDFFSRLRWVVQVQRISIRQAGEVAVDGLGMQEVFFYDPVLPVLQDWVDLLG